MHEHPGGDPREQEVAATRPRAATRRKALVALLPPLGAAAAAEADSLFRPGGDMHLHERGQARVAAILRDAVLALANADCP